MPGGEPHDDPSTPFSAVERYAPVHVASRQGHPNARTSNCADLGVRWEARGGGTSSPWLVVSASPNTASMIFHISQQLWDKVVETAEAGGQPFDLAYNRKVMQAQLDNIQKLIDNPPPAPTASLSTQVSPRSGSITVIGATVAIVAATAVAGVQV
ncbi:hypothetical protein ACFC1U_20865, partial [Bacillus subtilis]|uniref:hypothetical protein n=1 Tax=Bacillus subtilis TaxID=1423 RepID=UPI0035E2F06E